MYKVLDFVKWALTHVKPSTIPSGAALPLPIDQCGTEPWQYLFGSVRVRTNESTLTNYFENHYKNQMTRAEYDDITRDWDRNGFATDCQGLCDAYLTYECGETTDINADMNYRYWCTDRGKIGEIDRPFVIGEAVFRANSAGTMKHVGWICGFDIDGDPLIVEARGIYYGVVVTRLDGRDFTHRGLMTKKFNYSEEPKMKTKFENVSPMHTGEEYRAMQHAMNLAGYRDANGNKLEEDGKWGRKSQQAFDAMVLDYAEEVMPIPDTPDPVVDEPIAVFTSDDGKFELHFREAKG